VEKELCSASAEFEDFVLQFIDRYRTQSTKWILYQCFVFFFLYLHSPSDVCVFRCFALIDISTLEQTREEMETEKMTHLESLLELGLSSTLYTILTQCSMEIFQVITNVTNIHMELKLVITYCTLPFKSFIYFVF